MEEMLNVELGAGCNDFGKRFFSPCYLTDKDIALKDSCDSHCIDCFCDAYKLPFSENSFKRAIICNPFGYGFKDSEPAKILIKELYRILVNNGEIIIISNAKRNPYTIPQRIEKWIQEVSLEGVVRFQ